MSETAASREIFAPYCKGVGLDMGFGGDLVVPNALGYDYPKSYTNVGQDLQTFRGDCADTSGFCDNCMDFIHASHICEDWYYQQLRETVIPAWHRILKPGGYLLVNCPDQARYLAVNERNGTMDKINLAHKEPDMSLTTWKEHVINQTGPWEIVFEQDNFGDYSWLMIAKKL